MPWRFCLSRGGRGLRGTLARSLGFESLEARWVMAGVPAFSSLTGANHTIFLDFDGHTVQNTQWNSYYNQSTLVAQAYNTDGNAASFGASELAQIEEAWKRVSEDFIAFNVNVTTVDPGVEALRKSGSGDTQWGIRVLITNESTMVTNSAERTGGGGIAWINSFTWNSDTPALVFTTGAKGVAEAASHEAGHSLGLSHDGTGSSSYYGGHGSGATGWAPIMGTGYSRNVTQWDNGAYSGSNNAGSGANYNRGPDDLAVILGYNGFGYRVDDHGNTSGTATQFSGNLVSAAGIIERSTDVDYFTFTTSGGNVTLDIDPFAIGPNLDIKADLYDSAGTLVASSNSATVLDASFSLNLAAGQYYLQIDGVGSANYSDYASIGRYTITGSIGGGGGGTPAAQLSIADVSFDEAVGTAIFNVVLSGAITAPVTVNYSTANGSAASSSDFTATSGTLTFTPGGAATQQIVVAINNDTAVESSEQFYVNLSGASGAVIADGQAIGTIADNDVAAGVGLSISDVTLSEGDWTSGSEYMFTVRLATPATQTVTVQFATADGSGVAGSDYKSKAGTVTFARGQSSKTVRVTVLGNRVAEFDETFFVRLSNATGAVIVDGEGVGTMLNDDGPVGAAAEPIVDAMWYFDADAEHSHEHDHLPASDAVDARALAWAAWATGESGRERLDVASVSQSTVADKFVVLATDVALLTALARPASLVNPFQARVETGHDRQREIVADVRTRNIDKWLQTLGDDALLGFDAT